VKRKILSSILIIAVFACLANVVYLLAQPPAVPANTLNNLGLNEPYVISVGGYAVGANEIITAARAATFITLDTGQGANELYGMDQNVLSTSSVIFDDVNVTDELMIDSEAITNWDDLSAYIALGSGNDTRTATIVISAVDSLNANLTEVDYRCDGVADQVQVQAAVTALAGIPGRIILLDGNFAFADDVDVASGNIVISGQGQNLTIITCSGLFNAFTVAGAATDNRINFVEISDMSLIGAGAGVGTWYGVYFNFVNYVRVEGLFCSGWDSAGIKVRECDIATVENCEVTLSGVGIELGPSAKYMQIENCDVFSVTGNGVQMSGVVLTLSGSRIEETGSYGVYALQHMVIANNHFDECGTGGASIYVQDYSTVTGNAIKHSYGHGVQAVGNTISVTGNHFHHFDVLNKYGIYVTGNDCSIVGNTFWEINYYVGHVAIKADTADNTLISGNDVYDTQGNSIELLNSNYCLVTGNLLNGADSYNLVINGTSSYNTVTGNKLFGAGTAEVIIGAITCVGNDFSGGNSIEGVFTDNGATTIFPMITVPLVTGTEFDTTGPFGWYVNDTDEYAATMGEFPEDVYAVKEIRIYAVSLNVSATGMSVNFQLYAAANNETYTTESVQLANFGSITQNFGVNDVIYWSIDPTDDADLGHITGSDAWCAKILYNIAYGDDIQTDAVFYCVVFDYY